MPATNYTQPTRTAENRNMTASTFMGIPLRRLSGVAFAFLSVALLIAVPASLGAQVAQNLTLSHASIRIVERTSEEEALGTQGTYMVVLNTRPTGTVTVTVASDDKTIATVEDPGEITFTVDNWYTPRSITVIGVDDDIANPTGGRHVTIRNIASGGGFKTAQTKTLLVVVANDDDKVGLTKSRGSVIVTEKGIKDPHSNTATYTVKLSTKPTGTVTVTVASDDTRAATAKPNTLTFDAASGWDKEQTVTVTGVDDGVDNDPDERLVKIKHSASGGGYDAVKDDVKVTVVDGGTVTVTPTPAGLAISPLLIRVPEAGLATYTVALKTEPTGNVVVRPQSDGTSQDASAAAPKPGEITFTTGNYNRPQTVTVHGVPDNVDTGDRTLEIKHLVTGGGYNAVPDVSVSVTVADDDTKAVKISRPTITIPENGGYTDYTAWLATEPTGTVTVTVTETGTEDAATVSESSLEFTKSTWKTPQTVTVTGENDDVDNGRSRTVTITHTAAGGGYSDDVTVESTVTCDGDRRRHRQACSFRPPGKLN